MMQFPWSAVVGQESLKHALILCAIDPAIGGVLIHGPRGVAKTTLARALAELVPGKFVELPLGATEERVTGTLNLELALQDGRVEFAPGLLARANEGVLYVDEVNLLPDALVDLLLDAAATGRNVVERDGVSHAHPARFVLIGSMNPEEGELRPQLIDRFGLSASAQGVIPAPSRAEIVTRRLDFDQDPEAFRTRFAAQQAALVERCQRARERARSIPMTGPALARVTERCHAAGVEGVRADLAMLRAARANAAWNDRMEITSDDVDAVAELALAHRVSSERSGPQGGGGRGGAAEGGGRGAGAAGTGGRPQLRGESADASMRGQPNELERAAHPGGGHFADADADARERASGESGGAGSRVRAGGESSDRSQSAADEANSGGALPARPVQTVAVPDLPRWMTDARGRRAGKHSCGAAQLSAATGRRARATPTRGTVDWFATLSAPRAADLAPAASRGASARRIELRRDNLRYRSRRTPASQLWIVAVDCSSSMLRSGGLSVAKGVAHALEVGARRAGARLAVISFRGQGARLEVDSSPGRAVLPRAIAALGGGGGTPLHEALSAAHSLCKQTRWRAPGIFKRFFLLTDGRVRETPSNSSTLPTDLERIVVDCERGRVQLGRAQPLAAALRADYWRANP
jgi:Mg-chelatase subunit ChlI/Mg-chelatase subunit ChlD